MELCKCNRRTENGGGLIVIWCGLRLGCALIVGIDDV